MNKSVARKAQGLHHRRKAPLLTAVNRTAASQGIAAVMNGILANVFALCLKTRSVRWHMSAPHLHDYHSPLDEQADQLYAMSEGIAECIRSVGGSSCRWTGSVAGPQPVPDDDAGYVEPLDMLAELCWDNEALVVALRVLRDIAESRDSGVANLIEAWTAETERRTSYLFAVSCKGNVSMLDLRRLGDAADGSPHAIRDAPRTRRWRDA